MNQLTEPPEKCAERQKINGCWMTPCLLEARLLKMDSVTGIHWNTAIQRSKGHETSNCHLCAVRKTAFVAASQNVASSRSKAKRDKTLMVRGALRRIITSLAFLAKEGLAI